MCVNKIKNGSGLRGILWVTYHDDQKLERMESLSTSCRWNRICQSRVLKGIGICKYCYADRQLKYKTALEMHLQNNLKILRNPMEVKDIEKVIFNTDVVRIESFGDVETVAQCVNYIQIIYNNPNIKFGIWSKNRNLWKQAFELYGKPSNCNYIHSSLELDSPDVVNDWFIDYIFTVYSSKEAVDKAVENGAIRCNGIKCRACMHCYLVKNTTGIPKHIAELKR